MKEELLSNFDYIQSLIDSIRRNRFIDIKQISDLQRYVEMQKNIVDSLYKLDLTKEV